LENYQRRWRSSRTTSQIQKPWATKPAHVVWEDIATATKPLLAFGIQPKTPEQLFHWIRQSIAAIHIDFRQGRLQRTGDELDLAIDGIGFFQVSDPSERPSTADRGASRGRQRQFGGQVGRFLSIADAAITVPRDATAVIVGPKASSRFNSRNNRRRRSAASSWRPS